MQWQTIISLRGLVLHDPTQLTVARAALSEHFAAAGCDPLQAAQATFEEERPLQFAEDGSLIDDESSAPNGARADAWRAAEGVVAKALGLRAADVSVELQFEEPPVRIGPFDPTTAKRLFVGVFPSKEAQEQISAYQMKWQWPAGARLVVHDQLHITLAFLGSVDQQDEDRIRTVLQATSLKPTSIRLTEATTFRGGIAVLRSDGNSELFALRESIRQKILSLGLAADTLPWKPHITLARAAEGCRPPRDPPSIEMGVKLFSLVYSRPDPAHSYEVIASWPSS